MSARGFVILTAVAVVTSATSAFAQRGMSPRGYVTYGTTIFASSGSFEAVTGDDNNAGVGGGGALLGIWRGAFVDVGVSQQTLDGERVFVDGGTVYKLGVPVTIKMRPIDLAAGWRFQLARSLRRVSPYAGAGATFLSYKETSEFAGPAETVNDSKSGALFLAGVDVAILRWVHAGAEYRFRSVKGVLGDGGVSEVFNEDQLGGYAFAVRISVGK